MIEILKFTGSSARTAPKLARILNRGIGLNSDILTRTDAILREIRERGDEALIEFTTRFDGVALTPETLRVGREVIEELASRVDDELIAAMREAIANIRHYHEHQLAKDWEIPRENGVRLGQRVRPLEIVGLYVPGGSAAYPSTVMMNAVPAQVAGVERIVVVTPPAQFRQNPVIAAVLKELGLFEVYTIGGAQAVAALAYGTASIPRVDKIVGPGNSWVAAAKKLVYGMVDIDSIAGPSEILVLADGTTPPDWVAMDLFSQAEHDELAQSILLCPDAGYIAAVKAEIERLLPGMPRRDVIRASLDVPFGRVTELSQRARPGAVNGLARGHKPDAKTWAIDAERAWDALDIAVTAASIATRSPFRSPDWSRGAASATPGPATFRSRAARFSTSPTEKPGKL